MSRKMTLEEEIERIENIPIDSILGDGDEIINREINNIPRIIIMRMMFEYLIDRREKKNTSLLYEISILDKCLAIELFNNKGLV